MLYTSSPFNPRVYKNSSNTEKKKKKKKKLPPPFGGRRWDANSNSHTGKPFVVVSFPYACFIGFELSDHLPQQIELLPAHLRTWRTLSPPYLPDCCGRWRGEPVVCFQPINIFLSNSNLWQGGSFVQSATRSAFSCNLFLREGGKSVCV